MNQATAKKVLESGCNVFLTGDAGTGKSWLLTQYLEECERKHKSVLRFAPTGPAALHIGGQTIHKGFRAPVDLPDMISKHNIGYDGFDIRAFKGQEKRNNRDAKYIDNLRYADVIVIDEVSMVTPALMDYVYNSLEAVGSHAQVIVCGDFHQLPPVLDVTTQYYPDYCGKNYCFETDGWKKFNFHPVMLTVPMRQKDGDFLQILQRTSNSDMSVVSEYQQFVRPFDEKAVTFCGRNDTVNMINRDRLAQIDAIQVNVEASSYSKDKNGRPTVKNNMDIVLPLKIGARVTTNVNDFNGDYVNGTMGSVTNIFIKDCNMKTMLSTIQNMENFEEDDVHGKVDYFKSNISCPEYYDFFQLKRDEAYDEWCLSDDEFLDKLNVHMDDVKQHGISVKSSEVTVSIKTDDNRYIAVDEYNWGPKSYKTVIGPDGEPCVTEDVDSYNFFHHLPLRLGYALTIHKSQGATYDNINIVPEIFEAGQFYVALSRCTTADGVHLSSLDGFQVKSVDNRVQRFYHDVLKQDSIDCHKYGYRPTSDTISPRMSSDLPFPLALNAKGQPKKGMFVYKIYEDTEHCTGTRIRLGRRFDVLSDEAVASYQGDPKEWICDCVITKQDADFLNSVSVGSDDPSSYTGAFASRVVQDEMCVSKKNGDADVVSVERPSLAKQHILSVTEEFLPKWGEAYQKPVNSTRQKAIAAKLNNGHGGHGGNSGHNAPPAPPYRELEISPRISSEKSTRITSMTPQSVIDTLYSNQSDDRGHDGLE